MNIFLINPSGGYHHEYPTIGLLSIAACLRQQGHAISFLDDGVLSQPNEEYLGVIEKNRIESVVISLYTTNLERAFQIIRRIRSSYPAIQIIAGGHHATALPELTLQECPEIDILVKGEGEQTLLEVYAARVSGSPLTSVRGIYFHEQGASEPTFTGERPYIQDLDALPLPAHDLVCIEDYQKNPIRVGQKVGSLVTSRGCPFDCVFCNKSVFQSKIRRRSADSICDEIEHLVNVHGVDEIYFQDDLFALDRKWLKAFVDTLKRRELQIPWRMLARVDILEARDYAMIREAGCYLVQFGVESGNDEILKDIKKNITTRQIREAFSSARSAGLLTYGFFIFGHRLDTYETILETFRLAKETLCDFTSFFLLVPFPGTQVYELLPDELRGDWRRIQYVNWNKGLDPISVCSVPGGMLKRFEAQANVEFYSRPAFVRYNLLQHRGPVRLLLLKVLWWLRYSRALVKQLVRREKRAFREIEETKC